jgi:UDP-N-acetylglucosamine--N-acetylmuramyl-(pentapeptide) pyrophosphoryl-undecaprenol N-acetylglucosamine transferase
VRKEILKIREEMPGQKNIVLIVGGSSGSHHLNMAMAEAANYLQGKMGSKKIVHLTGDSDFSFMKKRYEEVGLASEVYTFSHCMEEFYGRTFLVIARAGATTLSEITVAGLPAILIPYPYAGAHQLENARWLQNKGGAILIEERELNGKKLAGLILGLINNEKRLTLMAEKAKEAGMPMAAELMAERVEKLAGKNSNQSNQ